MAPKAAVAAPARTSSSGGLKGVKSSSFSISKALSKLAEGPSAEWEKEEALDFLHWSRQLLGLVFGILWGYFNMPGLLGFIAFLSLNITSIMLLQKTVMGIDDDEWENAGQDLMQEGMPLSMSVFMVAWVLSYNTFHV